MRRGEFDITRSLKVPRDYTIDSEPGFSFRISWGFIDLEEPAHGAGQGIGAVADTARAAIGRATESEADEGWQETPGECRSRKRQSIPRLGERADELDDGGRTTREQRSTGRCFRNVRSHREVSADLRYFFVQYSDPRGSRRSR